MRTFFFYRDEDGWFVDLPEWEGDKEELQMVAGADHFLDILSQGEDGVHVTLSEEPFSNADALTLLHLGSTPGLGSGAVYALNSYNNISYDFPMWLCDVTKFVFGKFPDMIYFRRG